MLSKDKIKKVISKFLNIDLDQVTISSFYIKEEKISVYVVENLTIDNEKVFKYNIFFKNCHFKFKFKNKSTDKRKTTGKLIFENCVFEKDIDLIDVNFDCVNFIKCKFEGTVKLKSCVIGEFSDKNSIFQKKLVLYDKIIKESCIFKDKTEFIESVFQRITDFSHCVFESDITFKKCEFLYDSDKKGKVGDADADFSSIDFRGEVYFDQSKFKGFAAFHMSKFAKQTSFYETEFDKMPNFSPGNFGNVVYFNTTRWKHDFEFENIKESIETAYNAKGDESDKKRDDQLKENIINFRDSCRAIKNTLIEQNNLLDAQNFHKAELYCKEIELKKELKNHTSCVSVLFISIAMAAICLLDAIYFKSISVYAADISIINIILISLIVCFCLIVFMILICNKFKRLKFLNIDKQIDYLLLLLYRCTSEHHTNLSRIFHITIIVIASYGVAMLLNEYVIIEQLINFLMSFVCFSILTAILYLLYSKYFFGKAVIYFGIFCVLLCEPQILNPALSIGKSDEYKNTKLNEVMDNSKELLNAASIVAHDNPSTQSLREIIIENKNIIKNSKELNVSFDSIKQAIRQDEVIYATRQSMSVIYIVLLVLCLYSLQKTARKNTIVPS